MSKATRRFIVNKVLEMLITLVVVTLISFLLVRLSPIDPAEAYARRSFAAFSFTDEQMEALREDMGLNDPLPVQYVTWVRDALHLDFGKSFVSGQPVFEKVTTAIGITVTIVLISAVIQAVFILLFGCLCYLTRKRMIGHALIFLCIAGVSIPSFFFASTYLDIFAVKLGLTSVAGNTGLMRYLPAAVCIGIGCIALFSPIILNFNGNLSDLSVRQALAYAIDKEAISEGLTYGYEPVANTIVPDGTPYSDICGTEDYSYNVDRANQLLDEAGWIMNQSTGIREKNGTPLHVVFTCPTDDSTIGSIATLFQSQLAEVGIEVEIKSMEKMEWYASYMNPAGWDITAMTAGFFNYAMPQCWFSAMMAQMPEDVSIPLLDNSDEFISALSEFKTCNDDARLKELFELLINTDLDQVLDVPLTHQMDMIVYNTDKIADYNFASDYAFLDVTQITPAE